MERPGLSTRHLIRAFRVFEWAFILSGMACLSLPVVGWMNRIQIPDDARLDAHLDAECRRFCQKEGIPGMAVALFQDNKAYIGYFGVRDRLTAHPIDSATIFELGEASTCLTSTMVQILDHFGYISWNYTLTQIFPPHIRPTINDNTNLRHLASHTSGYPNVPALFRDTMYWYYCNPYRSVPEKLYYDYLTNPSDKLPPSFRQYTPSMVAMGFLGDALEIHMGKPLPKLFREYMDRTLNMPRTQFEIYDSSLLATGHNEMGEPTCYMDFDRFYAGHGYRSSLSEMARYVRAHLDPKQPTYGIFRRMWAPVYQRAGFGTSVGWLRDDWTARLLGFGPALFSHGKTAGFTSFVGFLPEKNIGMVLLANQAHPKIAPFAFHLMLLGGQVTLTRCDPNFIPPKIYRHLPDHMYLGENRKVDTLLQRLKRLRW